MEQNSYSYLSSKCLVVKAPEKGGYAVLACEPIAAGELVAVWSGRIVTTEELERLEPAFRQHSVQVEDGLFLTSLTPNEGADYINHCCDPNVGLSGQIALLAMRAIAPGEEITFDYAMTDGSPYDEFPCACGAALCRGRVTGEDWRLPALWQRYDGYFSPYLQRRIAALQQEQALSA
jgi:SET domain-containing protein